MISNYLFGRRDLGLEDKTELGDLLVLIGKPEADSLDWFYGTPDIEVSGCSYFMYPPFTISPLRVL